MSVSLLALGLPERTAPPPGISLDVKELFRDCFPDEDLRAGALTLLAALKGSGDVHDVLAACVSGEYLFPQVLRHELAYARAHYLDLSEQVIAARQSIIALEARLEGRYGLPGVEPLGRDAPLQLVVQARLAATPHWPRLGPVFLRSLAAKEAQMRAAGILDEETIRARLKGFLGYPLILAERLLEGALPAAPARLASPSGRPVSGVLSAVRDYVRERGLARSTRHTIIQRWVAACDVAPIEAPYRQRGASALHRLKAHYRVVQEREQVIEPEEPTEHATSPKAKGRSHLPTYYLTGIAPRALTPSRFSQNALPLTILAHISALVARRPLVEQQALHLFLHFGRSPAWICAHPATARQPGEDCLHMGIEAPFNWPARYVDMARHDPEDMHSRAFWEVHAEVYEPVALEPILPLPARIFEAEAGQNDALLTTQAGEPITQKDLRRFLRDWTEMLASSGVSSPAINVGRLHQSFDGLYADAGLSPEERFFVSGRRPAGYTLSCWYHSLTQGELLERYTAAYEKVYGWLASCEGVELPDRSFSAHLNRQAGRFLGHPRRARADRVAQITRRAIRRYRQAEARRAPLAVRYQQLVNLLVCGLLLCYGLRPFELGRLSLRHLELESERLVVDGKARPGEDAVRLLPLVPPFDHLFAHLVALRKRLKLMGHSELLLGLTDGDARPLDRQAVEGVLRELNGERRHTPPEAYSWRVLHYGLACQVLDLPQRRYLMGHETSGLGATNPYGPGCMPGLRAGLLQLVAHINRALTLDLTQLAAIHAHP